MRRSKNVRGFLKHRHADYIEDFDKEQGFFRILCTLNEQPIWFYTILNMGFFSVISALIIATISLKFRDYNYSYIESFYHLEIFWMIELIIRVIRLICKMDRSSPTYRLILILTFFGIIPVEIIIPTSPFIKNMASLNRELKIFMIFRLFHQVNNRMKNTIFALVLQTFFLITYSISVFSFLYTFLICWKDCYVGFAQMQYVVYILNMISCSVNGRGFGYDTKEYISVAFTLFSLFTFMFIFCLYAAFINFEYSVTTNHKCNFRYKYVSLRNYFRRNLGQEFLEKFDFFYMKVWNVCEGYEGLMAEKNISEENVWMQILLPPSYIVEIQADIYFGALVHSGLFKSKDIALLREVSYFMKQYVYIEGQYVFHKGELKDKLVYIFRGRLAVISEEDGETPLIKLADGSCIGETTIVLPYRATSNTVCKTKTCIVHVLEHKDFIKFMVRHPIYYKEICNIVINRYRRSKTVHHMKSLINNKSSDLLPQCLTMMWIKYTLHGAHAAKDWENAKRHAAQNIFTYDIIDSTLLQYRFFVAKHLRLYALSERDVIDSDTLFIKTTFPFILRPNTTLLIIEEIIISIIALIAAIYLPYIILIVGCEEFEFPSVIYLITFIWWIDLLIQLRTAIEDDHFIISSFSGILGVRLRTFAFICDIISCIPLEFWWGLFGERGAVIYFNRLLKTVRIYKLLIYWERKYNSNTIFLSLSVISFVFFFVSYFWACLLFHYKCFGNCGLRELRIFVYYVVQMITGAAVWVEELTDDTDYYIFNVILYIGIYVGYTITYAYVVSAFAFSDIQVRLSLSKLKTLFRLVSTTNQSLVKRLETFVRIEFQVFNGIRFYIDDYIYKTLPKPFLGHIFERLYMNWITEIPIFKGLPRHVVSDVLQNAGRMHVHCSGAVIFHVGDILSEIFILSEGFCEKVCGVTKKSTIVQSRFALNDMEGLFEIPVRSSCITLSTCDIIKIDIVMFKRILIKHSRSYGLQGILENMRTIKKSILNIKTEQLNYKNFESLEENESSFIYHINDPSLQFKWGKKTIQLLRVTINPNGRFFFIWEHYRHVCAFFTVYIYSTTILIFLPLGHPISILLGIFEISAFLDIILRFFVCYYDQRGLLISHPLMTAKHYISTAFIVDCIAFFPTRYVITHPKYIYATWNTILQLYRYIGLIRYYFKSAVVSLPIIYMFAYVPLFLVLINCVVTVHISKTCRIIPGNSIFDGEIDCFLTSFLSDKFLAEKLTPITAHIYMYYIAINAITAISFQGFKVLNYYDYSLFFIFLCSALGLFWNLYLIAISYRHIFFANLGSIYNDINLRIFFTNLQKNHVTPFLMRYIKNFLETSTVIRRLRVFENINLCPKCLQRDLIFAKFGKTLIDSCLIHAEDFEPFIRNILLHAEYAVVTNDGHVFTVNDVIDRTYFIFSGKVELVGANGYIYCGLGTGSIVGNLCNLKYNRMTASVIAFGIVETLSVKTEKFFKVLQHFPDTKREFNIFKNIHLDHIPGYSLPEKYLKKEKDLTKLYYLKFVGIFCGCYLPNLIYLYQAAISELHIITIFITILLDVFYIICLVLYFYLPFQTRTQIISFPKDVRNYRIKKIVTWVYIFSAMPLYIVPYFLPMPEKQFYYYFVFCRMNVLIRFLYFFREYLDLMYKVGGKLVWHKHVLLLLTTIFIVFLLTAFLLVPSELSETNMSIKIERDYLLKTTSFNRFFAFFNWFNVILNAFAKVTQIVYYPVSFTYLVLIIIICIILMLCSALFYAILISLLISSNYMYFKYVTHFNHLVSYLKISMISGFIIERVTEYAEKTLKMFGGLRTNTIEEDLPNFLRMAHRRCSIGYFVDNSIFLNCHPDMVRQIYPHFCPEFYSKGDIIHFKNSVDQTMCLVFSGSVMAWPNATGKSVLAFWIYTRGKCFGIPQGILGEAHTFTYKASSDTIVYTLKMKDWSYLLPFFPSSRDRLYKAVRDVYADEVYYVQLY